MRAINSNRFESQHLLKGEQIELGSFYTPKKIVDRLYQLIKKYKAHPQALLFDSSAGAGAFLPEEEPTPSKAVECDPLAGEFLKRKFSKENVFIGNALLDVSREKYQIAPTDFLIQIGNPPYNDTTSAYKNGQKGRNICDKDLFDRDLGISFLKSYNKLKADVVCVLHPLSYLIKPANFKRLKPFSQNYQLQKGVLFSSTLFKNVSSIGFPIVIALYEKKKKGMEYENIKTFPFSILDSQEKVFCLKNYETVDSFIRKYPPKKTDPQTSDIGIYYYTFRDINSLMRNKGFHTTLSPNSVVVSLKEFYKYAYLFSFKKYFQPKMRWLYGNLSPLGYPDVIEKNKKLFVKYALLPENKVFFQLNPAVKSKICKFYSLQKQDLTNSQSLKLSIFQIVNSVIC